MLPSLTDSRMLSPAGTDSGNSHADNEPGNNKTVSIVSVSRQSGDGTIRLSGSADLLSGSAILYEVWPENAVTLKKTTDEISGVSGRTLTYTRNASVVWSVDLDTASWKNGEYVVNAWPEQLDPLYGDRKKFTLPLEDSIRTGTGKDAGNGEIILNEVIPSELSSVPDSITPLPTPDIPLSTQPASPAVPVTVSMQDPGSLCNLSVAGPRVPVPVDTSVPIRDPMPGIRYSLNESDSDRTIVLDKGETVEINLRWRPGHGLHWIVPVSGCGLDLVNDGYYDTGTDFWNTSGYYRARYRAVSPGTSVLNGDATNKWIILDACNVLTDTDWGSALKYSHGLLGFTSDKTPSTDLPDRFLRNTIDNDYTISYSWQRATQDTYQGSGYGARVIFDTPDQLNNDHLSGQGTVASNELVDDNTVYVSSWMC